MKCIDHLVINNGNFFGAFSMLFLDTVASMAIGLLLSGLLRIIFYKKISDKKQFSYKNLSISLIGLVMIIFCIFGIITYANQMCVKFEESANLLRITYYFLFSILFTVLFLGYDVVKKIIRK